MKNLHILVVDDDRDFAAGLADVLELHGHKTTVSHSGETALEAFTEVEFDVIFMDMKLPGWSGIQSFRAFRHRFPGAKVVMMTAYSLDNLVDISTEQGVIGAFHKPLAVSEIHALLDRVRQELRVLIVDDDVDFAREIRDMLELAGYSVRSCFDGTTAIQRCLEETFDAMVLDMCLPGACGAEVYQTVRKAHPDLRIVTMTGYDQDSLETQLASAALPATQLLRKPFGPDSLIRMLAESPLPD